MKLATGVSLQVQETRKFKDIGISIRFMAPLKKETAALRSLLAIMICDRCIAYPTKKAMSDQQDTLYGATLAAQTVGYGQAQVLEIRTKVIEPRYVKEQTLLQDVLAFLHEVIYHPLLNEETFQESKAILKSKLQRMKDDPAQYVITKGLERAGKGTPLAISSLGDLEQLEQITLADVIQAHRVLLEQDRIDMIVCGNVQEETMKHMIQKALPFQSRKQELITHYRCALSPDQDIVYETRDINQCGIFMIWQTDTDICDEQYYALRLATAMFGQYPTSLLFQEVREKHSLCYSIYANLISFDGALGVTTGVEPDQIEAAMQLIHAQFDAIRSGAFDDHLLEVSKTMMINSLKATKDAMNSIMAQQYQNAVLEQSYRIDDRIAMVEKVTKEEVLQAFAKCEYRMGFVLCPEVKG